jgi:hypothetical protein
MLRGFADNGTNTGSRGASDEASLQSSAHRGTEDRTASASDERGLAWSDTATFVIPLVITVRRMARIVVLAAAAALPDAVVKILIVPRLLVSVIAVAPITATILISAVVAAVLTMTGFVSLSR